MDAMVLVLVRLLEVTNFSEDLACFKYNNWDILILWTFYKDDEMMMMDLIVNPFNICIGVLLIILHQLYRIRAKTTNGVPKPSTFVPFFGNIFALRKNKHRLYDWGVDNMNEMQCSFQTSVVGDKLHIIMKPSRDNAEFILKTDFENTRLSRNRQRLLDELVGKGIFGVNGAEWLRQRKAASHMFSANKLKTYMFDTFMNHARVFVEVLDEKAKDDLMFNIEPMMFQYTMDSFVKIAFGEDQSSLRSGDTEFGVAFDELQEFMLLRFMQPLWWNIKRFLNIGTEAMIRTHLHTIQDYVNKVVERRELEIARGESQEDLVTYMLHERKKRSVRPYTHAELRDIVLNFVIAGRDTTACLMTWFMWRMTQHPEVYRKVNDEIDDRLGDRDFPNWDDLTELRYLQNVLFEVLRLHPPVPIDGVENINECVLPDGTQVPPDTIVQFDPYVWGRSELLWGPTALDFDPDRWADGEHEQYKFVSFKAGRRICLGKRMAIMEACGLLSTVLHKFHFSRPDDAPEMHYTLSVVLKTLNGCWVKARRRRARQ